MALYITQIGKHRFICGLFWQSLSRPRELMNEAKQLAKKIDADLMVLRMDHSTAQAGFAQSREGAKRKMFSLAAAVSKTLAIEGAYYDGVQQPAHNWLGAFKLPDGRWAYFAVRDANFLPNGDFAGTKADVLDRLHSDYGLGGWNVVIGDEELAELGLHNFNAKRIENMLPQKKDGTIRIHRWWGLRQVNTKRSWRPALAVGALAAALAVAGFAYWKYDQRKRDELQRQQAAAARNGHGPQGIPHPWATKPPPMALAQACVDRQGQMTPGGWLLDEYVCTADQVAYSWARANSTIRFLLAQEPDAVIDLSGGKATRVVRLAPIPGTDEVLLDQRQLIEAVVSPLQLIGISLRMSRLPPPAAAGNKQAMRPTWQTFSFSVNAGRVAPTTLATILEQPGMRIDKLTYRGGEWSVEGVMYAN